MKKHLTKIYEQIVYGLRKRAVSACLKYNFPFEWQNLARSRPERRQHFQHIFWYFWCAKYAQSERILNWRDTYESKSSNLTFCSKFQFPCVVNMQIQPKMLNVCQCIECIERTIHLLYAMLLPHFVCYCIQMTLNFLYARSCFSLSTFHCLLWLLLFVCSLNLITANWYRFGHWNSFLCIFEASWNR